jgi:hypothetical protein
VHPRWHRSRVSSQAYGDFYICCEDVLVKAAGASFQIYCDYEACMHAGDVNGGFITEMRPPSTHKIQGDVKSRQGYVSMDAVCNLRCIFRGWALPSVRLKFLGRGLCPHPPVQEDRLLHFSRRPQGQGFLPSPVKFILFPCLISYFLFLPP